MRDHSELLQRQKLVQADDTISNKIGDSPLRSTVSSRVRPLDACSLRLCCFVRVT